MSQIQILDRLIRQYKLWTIKLKNASTNIENSILQIDAGDKIEEKIMSIGLSSIFVYVVSSVIAFFGISTGGFALIIFLLLELSSLNLSIKRYLVHQETEKKYLMKRKSCYKV
jgi:hypothetical protein